MEISVRMSFPAFHSCSVINLLDFNIIFGVLLDNGRKRRN